jgi:signal recognition particle receptor subunit beta
MAYVNYTSREINAKIVYYGPGLSGKTTNILYIHKKLNPETRGKLVSLATQTDRTLFFDFLPVNVGEIGNFKLRFHLYTVPGQIFYNTTRKMVLKGVDGVVFVADSQKQMLEDNIESLKNLEENLREYGKDIREIPLVIQYNKRDLPDAMDLEELHRNLNKYKAPFYTAVATQGQGVLETLTGICKLVINNLKKTVGVQESVKDIFESEISQVEKKEEKKQKQVILPEDYSDEALKMLDLLGDEKKIEETVPEEVQEKPLEPIEEDIILLEKETENNFNVIEKETISVKTEQEVQSKDNNEEDMVIIETESMNVKGNEIELPLKIMAGGKEKAIKIRLKIEVGEE